MGPAASSETARRWRLAAPDPSAVARLERALRVPDVVARVLVNRGLDGTDAAHDHLSPDLTRLHDPSLLPDVDVAARRLREAVERGETILVHGDYDVDGVAGTAILVRLLRHVGARVEWHIPHRIDDGYSFGDHSIARAEAVGASLVLSVDNGTSAHATIAALVERGVDVVVTDHHEPPEGELPPALAIVNPKLARSRYPFRELCGSAVAFKLAWAVCQELTGAERVRDDLRSFLTDAMAFVALATVCDVVPLVDENRLLAHFGLRALAQRPSPGVHALLERCELLGRPLTAEDVGFQLGPRINASGRVDSAARALESLLADDVVEGRRAAARLDELNERRRELEREVLVAAVDAARPYADAERWPFLVVAGRDWHPGVVGIVAARLADRFARPTLVVALDGSVGRGSARSVPGRDVLALLRAGAEHMTRFGGHAQAAGCELEADRVGALRDAINAAARDAATGPPSAPPVEIDAELPLPLLDEGLVRELDRLEPCGEGNPRPVFLARDCRVTGPPRIVGRTGDHLLLELAREDRVLKGFAFHQARRAPDLVPGVPVHVAYTPRWNTFRGRTTLELLVVDVVAGDEPPLGG